MALFHHIGLRVMWSDTDPAGIVWFVLLNIFMPRASLQSGFRSPARLGDELAVGVGVSEMTERRIGFAFDVRERGTGRLVCEASYRVACVDATTFAPRAFPDEVVSLLAVAHQAPEDQGRTKDQAPRTDKWTTP